MAYPPDPLVTLKTHAQRVAANFPEGSIEHDVALFHDHLEDNLGIVPLHVLKHVQVLTRWPGEPYHDYITRIRDSGDQAAVAVKLADASDNLARCQGLFDGVPDGTIGKLRSRRYMMVIRELATTLNQEGDTET